MSVEDLAGLHQPAGPGAVLPFEFRPRRGWEASRHQPRRQCASPPETQRGTRVQLCVASEDAQGVHVLWPGI